VHIIDPDNFKSVKVALHMMKAFKAAIPDDGMKFNPGLDKMFGVLGFFDKIQTREVDEILQDCDGERKLFAENSRKVWLYNNAG